MFKNFVQIYRALGTPKFNDGDTLSINCTINKELQDSIEIYKNSVEQFGDIEFDFNADGTVEFDLKIPSYISGAIFRNMEDFLIKTPSILKGEFRGNFYIVDLNYLSDEDEDPIEIIKIKKLTEFIKSLRDFVSLSIDRDQALNGSKIFFLKPSDGKSPQKAATLKINMTAATANISLGSFNILKSLSNPEHQEKTQIQERVLLMNTAIAQIIDECEDDDADFDYLAKNWSRVNKKYLHDLHAYVSAFSFDTVKKKISDGLLDSTTKINGAIGEIGTKLLAVPASIGALIIINNSSNSTGFIFGIIGVIIASAIILRTIWHYENQVKNLARSFDFNLEETAKAKKTFNRAIQEEINNINNFKREQVDSINNSFRFYKFIATLPIVASLYYTIEALWPFIFFQYSLHKYCFSAAVI